MMKKNILYTIKSTFLNKNELLELNNDKIKNILIQIAEELQINKTIILKENLKDLENFEKTFSKTHANYDRLMLNEKRIEGIAQDVVSVANFDFSVDNNVIFERNQNNLEIKKISSPFGVISVIYESRPNVTVDVFALCFRSQNCCLLKGGKEALFSNEILVQIIKNVLKKNGISENIINLLTIDKDQMKYLLSQKKYIDLCIPRGSKGLINFVKKNSKIPVIETGAGVVHLYLDEQFDAKIASNVIFNSKTRRVSVCNSLDCLIVNKKSLYNLNEVLEILKEKKVILYCDKESYKALDEKYPYIEHITKEEIGKEFLDYKMSVISVSGIKQALKYISKYSSNHSDGIISNIKKNQNIFKKYIDSSVVYINTSTAFTDGSQFGLGSEIGISTQKVHARGPMGIESLRTIKYIVSSEGKIR